MAHPDKTRNSQLCLSIFRIVCTFPVTNTTTQAMIRTTIVRIAVPRLEFTPSIPTFPNMEVRLANSAEPAAYRNQPCAPFFFTEEPVCCVFPVLFCSCSFCCCPAYPFFCIISHVPAPMSTIHRIFSHVSFSSRNRNASSMVKIVLDLSTGVTLFTSPICNALK